MAYSVFPLCGLQHRATVTLTNAQVIALPTTPITIVPAQGTGTIAVPIYATFYMNWVADYGNINATGRLGIEYSGSLSSALLSFEETGSEVSNLIADGATHLAFLGPRAHVYTAGAVAISGLGQFIDEPGTANTALRVYAFNNLDGIYNGGNLSL